MLKSANFARLQAVRGIDAVWHMRLKARSVTIINSSTTMYKSATLAVLLCLHVGIVRSQDEIPVNLYTGTPAIEIPIWTLTDHDIRVPVSLTYAASGVKLQESAGWFGLGWDLIAAGSIRREVRGLPDDFQDEGRIGWNCVLPAGKTSAAFVAGIGTSADLSESTCSDELSDYNNMLYSSGVDFEPDVFYFNFAGHSGRFVFDDLSVRFMPYKDFGIEVNTMSSTDRSIQSFSITTPGGFNYTFAQKVMAQRTSSQESPQASPTFLSLDFNSYKRTVRYAVEWKLTRIKSPSGASVDFTYASSGKVESKTPVTVGLYKWDASSYSPVTQYSILESEDRYWLDKITGSSQKIIFERLSGETLDRITVTDGRNTAIRDVRRFALSYENVWSRKFLKKVTESNGCDKIPPYVFDYIGTQNTTNGLPPVTSVDKDFWGYYNGKKIPHPNLPTVANSIPKMYIYPNEPPSERFRIYPIPGYAGTEIILDGIDRTPNESFTKMGALNKVTYPTGGSLVIQYEANMFYDERAGREYPGGGLRIKSISQFDGMNNPSRITKTFSYIDPATGKSSGRLIDRPMFILPVAKYRSSSASGATEITYTEALATMPLAKVWKLMTVRTEDDLTEASTTQGSPVGYKVVTVKRAGMGSARFEFSMPGTYGSEATGFWKPTDNKFARPSSCPAMGIISGGGPWAYPFSPNPFIDFERGLVEKKYEFDEGGNPVRTTANSYQNIYRFGQQPKFVSGLREETYAQSASFISLYGMYLLPTEYDKVLAKETVTLYDAYNVSKNTSQTTEYLYDSPLHRYMTSVKRTDADGTVATTAFLYPDDYGSIPSVAEPPLEMIRQLQNPLLKRQSTIIESVDYIRPPGGVDQVVSASLTTYRDFGMSGKILPEKKFVFRSSIPVSDFIRSGVQSGSPARIVKDSRYECVQTILGFDNQDNALGQIGTDRVPIAVVWGYDKTSPVVTVWNATHGQFAFSNFDTSTDSDFKREFGFIERFGRSETLSIATNAALSKRLRRAPGNSYKLSFWIKTDKPVNYTLRITHPDVSATVYFEKTFDVDPANPKEFQFIEQLIPMDGVPDDFSVLLMRTGGDGLGNPYSIMDDIAFHPANSQMTYYGYDFPFGITSVTASHGVTTYTKFDNLGRTLYTYDQDRNITSRSVYNFSKQVFTLSADFTVPSTIYRDFEANFVATGGDNSCIEGLTYSWDMGDGNFVAGQSSTKYVFTGNPGKRTVRLKVSHPDFPDAIISKYLDVILKPVSVDLCVVGSTFYKCGRDAGEGMIRDRCGRTFVDGTIFIASPESIPGVTYNWQKRQEGSSSWVNIGERGSEYHMRGVSPDERDFFVRCLVTAPDGRTGATKEYSIIVYLCEHKGGKP